MKVPCATTQPEMSDETPAEAEMADVDEADAAPEAETADADEADAELAAAASEQAKRARIEAAVKKYRATLRNEAETQTQGFSADHYRAQKPPHWGSR